MKDPIFSSHDQTRTVLLATRNQGKIAELRALLLPFGLKVVGLDAFAAVEDVEETGTSFEANALLKASAACLATGLTALADDSGLEVDALDGAPGVFSARYSQEPALPATDERNIDKLLKALSEVADKDRTARFRCCMAACAPNGARLTAQGAWEGVIARQRLGGNGFGYDPVFFDPKIGLTAAQMNPEQKNALSHRAKAVQTLLGAWPKFWNKWLASR